MTEDKPDDSVTYGTGFKREARRGGSALGGKW